MDFEKIYADFESARAAHDLETISNIIVQVMEHCGELARTGRVNEIPPVANEIAAHVNVMIYYAMQLLSDGDAGKARFYLSVLASNDPKINAGFFFMYYLFGRALYLSGDYRNAAEIFARYEELRAKKFDDVDELSLFYRANCLALTGDFHAASQLYEKILRINATFHEAKKNLKLVRRGSVDGLAREIKSLWNFTNWRDVPIFINARDRFGIMKRMIDWLLDAGYRKLIILDNRSTYPPLLEYYSALESDSRFKVIRLEKNFGYKAIWLSGILERLKISTPYVYTDPDLLPVENCPKDFIKRFMEILDSNHE
ncbi:MAG: tetratricopeptide repeat protein, partial [Selenomonadaceae bacterium]|nr:tetratricopeptide repeat protein [Selenomonadaceae bacterium]